MIEFEGQRYLMNDIYKITSTDYDKLRIDKTIVDIDEQEGFMFVLTSYQFNEKSGIVIQLSIAAVSTIINMISPMFTSLIRSSDHFTMSV